MRPATPTDDGPIGETGQLCARRGDERGSALVLVLLILLALSALGMVALRDVSRSVQHSGQFRVRTSASAYSDAAAQFMAKRFGDKANSMWGTMERYQRQDYQDKKNQSRSRRAALARRGAPAVYEQNPNKKNKQDFGRLLDTMSGDESGLFTDGDSKHRSFESLEDDTNFKVIIRDPVDGIPVPGYSDRYCFKKVTFAARAELGDPQNNWSEPQQVGLGRTIFEGLVGPIECGS